MQFSEEEKEKLKKIIFLYATVKDWMLYAERIHLRKEDYIQSINGIINAFGNLTIACEHGLKSGDLATILTNLDTTLTYLYKSVYELLEGISTCLRDKIPDEIEEISKETLAKLFPKYYREIRPDIESIPFQISNFRANKVENIDKLNMTELNKYIKIVEKLKFHYSEVRRIKPGLDEYEREQRSKVIKSEFWGILSYIITGVVSMIIGAFLAEYLT